MPERMLAAVVRDLHANAVLEPGFIQMVTGGADHTELEQSNLDSAPERVKFTPAQLTLEELSRLWSIMVQSPYALSVAYLASVVEIEALESGTAALPVLKRGQDDRGDRDHDRDLDAAEDVPLPLVEEDRIDLVGRDETADRETQQDEPGDGHDPPEAQPLAPPMRRDAADHLVRGDRDPGRLDGRLDLAVMGGHPSYSP